MTNKRVALVTGASRGIGKAIFEALLKAGHTVVGTATGDKGIASINESLQAVGGEGGALTLNVQDDNSLATIFDRVKEVAGELPDILVNNAGITSDMLALRMSDEAWDKVIQTNLSSTFKLSRNALRSMLKKRWGRIINIGSVVGTTGNPGQANYVASKAGVSGMSKSLAYEVAKKGVTVNVVAPGFIQTDMTDVLTDDQKNMILQNVPAGRLGQPNEIAALVAFLSSENASYITGQTVHINGGLFMA